MSFFTKNKLFTLTLVPDSGYDVKSGSLNLRFIAGLFAVLTAVFFICFFFIIGYHIKLRQEKDYMFAISTRQKQLNNIKKSENFLDNLSEKVANIQGIDRAFRQFAYMPIPDNDMYKAGVGGHVIVDESMFNDIGENVRVKIINLLINIHALDRRVYIEENSIKDIRSELELQREEINNTPSILPTQSLNITSGFGMRINPITGRREFHDAVDFTGRIGDKIYATADGIVTIAGNHTFRGEYIIIKHKNGYQTLYAHLNNIFVRKGQKIKKYDVIGAMGRTGRTTGTNLHYSITRNGRAQNPLDYF